jgi:hypothetical protein
MSAAPPRLLLKLSSAGVTGVRLVAVEAADSCAALRARIASAFGRARTTALSWRDEDGDDVLLETDEDVAMLRVACGARERVAANVAFGDEAAGGPLSASAAASTAAPAGTAASASFAGVAPSLSASALVPRAPRLSARAGGGGGSSGGGGSGGGGSALRWQKGHAIGSGAHSVVSLGLNLGTGELMAVKQMAAGALTSPKDLAAMEAEIALRASVCARRLCQHPSLAAPLTSLSPHLPRSLPPLSPEHHIIPRRAARRGERDAQRFSRVRAGRLAAAAR